MGDNKKAEKKTPGSRRNSPTTLNIPSRHSPRNISPLAIGPHSRTASPKGGKASSPLASPLQSPVGSPTALNKTEKSLNTSGPLLANKTKRGTCPCNVSSEGLEWVFQCTDCRQRWHASCANLKGTNDLTQENVNSIQEYWLCPWCYSCCFPRPTSHPAAKKENTLAERTITCSTIQQITDTVSEVISQKLPNSLPTQLNQLSRDVQDLKKPSPYIREPAYNPTPPPATLISPEEPYKIYQEDFVNDEEESGILGFLTKCLADRKFATENGHSVLSFGAKYSYVGAGSNQNPDEIPPIFTSMIQKLKEDPRIEGEPNSILVNHYPECKTEETASYLPFHCDDEAVITPGTDIITITLGSTREITFKSIHNPQEETVVLEPAHKSMYVMSRSSQAWYKHGIERAAENEERFSITLRTVDVRNRRSVLVMGDSNTKNITFGTGKGKVGETYPGKRVKAARIKDIDPERCIGFSNVVIVCGTNDLREENIRSDNDIVQLVELLRSKLTLIRQISPSSKVFVCPVLPSRRKNMNQYIVRFNRLCDEMLAHCFRDIWYPGVWQFVDNNGLLSIKLTRGGDDIHLNEKGIALLVRKLKLWIFEREVCERRDSARRSNGQSQHGRAGSAEPP